MRLVMDLWVSAALGVALQWKNVYMLFSNIRKLHMYTNCEYVRCLLLCE